MDKMSKRKRWVNWPWWKTDTNTLCSKFKPLTSPESLFLLTYPRQEPERSYRIASQLAQHGVVGVCHIPQGRQPPMLPRTRILGLGRESLVLLVQTNMGPLVLKVRRTDSPRSSLEREATFHIQASKAGAAPRIHAYGKDYILMDPVPGMPLDQLQDIPHHIVVNILETARALDAAGILHRELSRPWLHIIVKEMRKTLIIDYGDATTGCGSLTKVIPPLARRGMISIPPRDLLNRYKKECSRNIFEKIIEHALQK